MVVPRRLPRSRVGHERRCAAGPRIQPFAGPEREQHAWRPSQRSSQPAVRRWRKAGPAAGLCLHHAPGQHVSRGTSMGVGSISCAFSSAGPKPGGGFPAGKLGFPTAGSQAKGGCPNGSLGVCRAAEAVLQGQADSILGYHQQHVPRAKLDQVRPELGKGSRLCCWEGQTGCPEWETCGRSRGSCQPQALTPCHHPLSPFTADPSPEDAGCR